MLRAQIEQAPAHSAPPRQGCRVGRGDFRTVAQGGAATSRSLGSKVTSAALRVVAPSRVTRSSRSSAAEPFRRASDGSLTGGSIGSRRADLSRGGSASPSPSPAPVVESRASRAAADLRRRELAGGTGAARTPLEAPTAPRQGLPRDGLRSDTVESSHGWGRVLGTRGRDARLCVSLPRRVRHVSDLALSELGFAWGKPTADAPTSPSLSLTCPARQLRGQNISRTDLAGRETRLQA